MKKNNRRVTAEGGLATKSQAESANSKEVWARWFLDLMSPGECLWVTVNLSNRELRLANDLFADRSLSSELALPSPSTIAYVSKWNSVWSKFFTSLRSHQQRTRKSAPITYVLVYENDTKKWNPSAVPTHSHLLVRVPANESPTAFGRRFADLFNKKIYPLSTSIDSSFGYWDVSPSSSGVKNKALVMKIARLDSSSQSVTNYLAKQVITFSLSERITIGGTSYEIPQTTNR